MKDNINCNSKVMSKIKFCLKYFKFGLNPNVKLTWLTIVVPNERFCHKKFIYKYKIAILNSLEDITKVKFFLKWVKLHDHKIKTLVPK